MGMHVDTLEFLWESVKAAGIETLQGKQMLELGNQVIRIDAKRKFNIESGYSKVYYLNLRCHHTAIDWNCQDGAVPIDMCQSIPIKRYINNFDIITDFGCMEHYHGEVEDRPKKRWGENKEMICHWQAWKNIHDMGKAGCLYIHTLPLLGSVPGHGFFHYDQSFFEQLCKYNNYKILLIRCHRHDIRTDTRDYLFCSYVKKEDKPFMPKWEVFKEWLHR